MNKLNDPQTSILIVDDNPQYTQVLSVLLKGVFGYRNITTVDRTESAYEMIAADPAKFQLLFVDFRFPSGETGGDLLQRLSKDALLQDKVAFLITSEPTVDNVKQAARAGAAGVVAKPFDREQLTRQLQKAIRWLETQQGESF